MIHTMRTAAIVALTCVGIIGAQGIKIYGDIGWGFGFGGLNTYGEADFASVDFDQHSFTSVTRNEFGQISEQEDHYVNYGSGFRLNVGGEFQVMDRLWIRTQGSWIAGIPQLDVVSENIQLNTRSTTTYARNVLGFEIVVVPRFMIVDLLEAYVGVGPGLFFGWMTYETTGNALEGKIKTKPAFALTGLFGADYPITDVLDLYGEIGFEAMTFVGESQTFTDDNEQLNFEKDSEADNVAPPPKFPGSNLGIRFGVRYSIL